MIKVKRCDNCGKFWPKHLGDNKRLCGEPECIDEKGFYKEPDSPIGTWGKIGWWKLIFPFNITWRGWLRPSSTPAMPKWVDQTTKFFSRWDRLDQITFAVLVMVLLLAVVCVIGAITAIICAIIERIV